MSQVHPQARTTPLIRAEIKAATGSQGELTARYDISVATLRKWQNRDQAQDRSHRPHKCRRRFKSEPAQFSVGDNT